MQAQAKKFLETQEAADAAVWSKNKTDGGIQRVRLHVQREIDSRRFVSCPILRSERLERR